MTSVYNQLYNNDAYNRMARAIADHMGVNYDSPTGEYLDVMVAIQDKALYYSDMIPYSIKWDIHKVFYHKDIYKFYWNFMSPFVDYYHTHFAS